MTVRIIIMARESCLSVTRKSSTLRIDDRWRSGMTSRSPLELSEKVRDGTTIEYVVGG